ncbi:heavy metal translocating P-type ATPase metal-binding domain-containing protein [Flammeovirgaceae bacterium SG7u.111]|nr:heavy metal translocating P-type ATPase metal-binding domain-containing protein [Flammeovirgaceae bacterium SG7u.132]WPO34516.1 heavy metal translocating P-type ATPase metal-binding domain-containing protein [Flammeovirgaceae bacterium SG7u.111]
MAKLADIDQKQQCYHCGEDCDSHPVEFDNQVFCCEGCKTVYEILQGNDLCEYYDLEQSPGKQQKDAFGDRFAYLDNEEIKAQLLSFSNGRLAKVTFFIPNIHCSSCIWLLENLHKLNPHVRQSVVNFPKKQATLTYSEEDISLRQLVELMARIGYAPEINLASGKKEKQQAFNKSFYIKLGVAGFCFGNIMLLSLPDYLDAGYDIDEEFRSFFGYLNLLLSLPIFFYAGTDYFVSAWKGLKEKYINIDVPISLGIITLFFRSAFEILSDTGTGYMDSLAGLVFFLLIGKWYQHKTYQALSFDRDYESYFPIGVTRILGAKEETVPIKQLQKGDRIRIRNHELIPADAVLLRGEGNIDYSFVTGESEPISRRSGDVLYAGGRQIGTGIEIEITKAVEGSYLTQLWDQDVFKKESSSAISNLAATVGKYFTISILLISLLTAVFWYFTDSSMIVNTVTSVLIVACPCALALSIPFTFGNSLRLLGKNGLFLKNTEAIENLSKINTIVFDKTGTLTDNQQQEITYVGSKLNELQIAKIKAVVGNSAHPLSQALAKHLESKVHSPKLESFEEIPSEGILATVGGVQFKVGSEFFTESEPVSQQGSKVYVSIDRKPKGCFVFSNTYRKGFEEVISKLSGEYNLHLLSGDNDKERKKLSAFFTEKDQLNFNQSPQDKLDYISKLKNRGEKVLMVGDGLNDAGALRNSDVGISISDDVYHFSPACDAILEAGKFHLLDKFISFSGSSVKVVKMSYVLSFLYNIVGLSFAVTGVLTPLVCAILMPLSSVSVVGFVTLVTNVYGKKMKVIS